MELEWERGGVSDSGGIDDGGGGGGVRVRGFMIFVMSSANNFRAPKEGCVKKVD